MAKNPGLGIEYEVLLPAYFGLQLYANPDIVDFTLESNAPDFENFDDLLINIILKNGVEEKFAFQLKHAARDNKRVLPTSFDVNRDFQLKKYSDAFDKIKNRNDYRFILFTNRNFDSEKMDQVKNFKMKKNAQCPGRKFFAPTSDDVYRFEIDRQSSFLDRFSFYAGQINSRCLEETITSILKTEYNHDEHMATNYINFFRRWQKKEFSSSILRKRDITIQILDLLVTPFWIKPILEQSDADLNLLQEVTKEFDVTVIEDSTEDWRFEFVESKEEISRMAKTNKIITKHAKELTLDLETKTLCYFRQYPLIIKFNEESKNSVTTAMKLCHRMDIKINFILLSTMEVEPQTLPFKTFRNLHDLFCINRNLYKAVIEKFKIYLPGNARIKLGDLIENDEEILKCITTQQLLKMSKGKFGFDKVDENLPKHYVARNVTKIILNLETINNLQTDLIIIDCDGELSEITSALDRKYVNFEEMGDRKNCTLILNEGECTAKQFEEICLKNEGMNVHHLKAMDKNNFEWLATNGSIAEIRNCHFTKCFTDESKISFRNKVNVVCANPGLGKSTLFRYLKNNYPSDFFTVIIDLKEHNSFFKTEHTVEDTLNYFLDLSSNTLLSKVKQVFVKRRKVCFFLDGLDELQECCMEKSLNYIKELSSLGFRIWISSRHNLREFLENKLNTFPIDVKEFDPQDQRSYVKNRLQKYYTDEESDKIIKTIFGNVQLANHAEVFGVPLQLFMVTQMLIQDHNLFNDFNSKTFILTKLYHCFFKGKYEHYINKIKCKHPHFLEIDLEDRLEKYKVVALQSCLDDEVFRSLDLDCREFIDKIKKEGDQMGVIVKITDSRAVFDQYSYCEYFAAVWLAENFSNVPNLKDFIFDKKYDNIRFIFDVKLAEELPAHLAVIYGDFIELTQHQQQICQKDRGGRNVLQIACCYGQQYPVLRSEYRGREHVILDRDIYLVTEECTERKNILALLLNSGCNPLEKDEVFQWESLTYADRTLHLFAIEEIIRRITPDMSIFNNYKDIPTLLYYASEFNYANLLDMTKELFQNENRRETYILGAFDSIYCHFEYRRLINLKNIRKESLLHVSVLEGHLKISKMLLGRGIDVNGTDKNKRTPLHLAVVKGCTEAATLLLAHAADIGAIDYKGINPLRYAISEGHWALVELLLEKGATVDCVPRALHLATMKGHTEIVALLLEHKIDINTRDEFGRSPFYWAISEGHLDIAAVLLSKLADVNMADKSGNSPLHWACHAANLKTVQFLLDIEANINVTNNNGSSPLHLAVMKGYTDIVELLLEQGANIDAIDKYYERTPLHFAVYEDHVDLIKILLDKGANINMTDIDKSLPLHLSVIKGNIDVVKLFLDKDTDINAITNNGSSPLHIAATKGYFDIGKLLLDKGAKINATDMFKGRNPLHLAIMNGHIKMAELLLDRGADIDAIDQDEWSPLHFAIHNQHFEILKLLVEKGIDISKLKKNDAHTPSPYLARHEFNFVEDR